MVGQTNYSAAKAGIVGMTKAASKELAHLGVRVNAIQPGLIRSAMTEAMPQRIWDSKVAEVPMGRAGEPEEVANVALFLASDLSSYMTGTVLEVTGGQAPVSAREAVICEPVRTPIGRYGGMFKPRRALLSSAWPRSPGCSTAPASRPKRCRMSFSATAIPTARPRRSDASSALIPDCR